MSFQEWNPNTYTRYPKGDGGSGCLSYDDFIQEPIQAQSLGSWGSPRVGVNRFSSFTVYWAQNL